MIVAHYWNHVLLMSFRKNKLSKSLIHCLLPFLSLDREKKSITGQLMVFRTMTSPSILVTNMNLIKRWLMWDWKLIIKLCQLIHGASCSTANLIAMGKELNEDDVGIKVLVSIVKYQKDFPIWITDAQSGLRSAFISWSHQIIKSNLMAVINKWKSWKTRQSTPKDLLFVIEN